MKNPYIQLEIGDIKSFSIDCFPLFLMKKAPLKPKRSRVLMSDEPINQGRF